MVENVSSCMCEWRAVVVVSQCVDIRHLAKWADFCYKLHVREREREIFFINYMSSYFTSM